MAVVKRGDRWSVSVYDPLTKGKRYVPGTYATQKEARLAEAQALLSRRRSHVTVADYAATWLEMHPRPKQSTMICYAETISHFVRSHGSRELESFDRREAREWALGTPWLVKVVRSMFANAKHDGLIADNPFTELRLEQSRGRRDLDVLTVEQVAELANIARGVYGPGFSAFVLTAAYCGMRPGELFALQWPRIRFAESEIEVAAQYSTRSGETTSLKNNRQRTIVLFPEARDALQNVPRGDGTYVFRTIKGLPLNGETLPHYWRPVRVAAGLPKLALYELRHFCAAHLLNTLGHEAEDVAYQLGHTDGGILVRKLYGHPSETLARDRLKSGLGRKLRLVEPGSGAKR